MTNPISLQQALANNVLLDIVAKKINAFSDRQLAKALHTNAPIISKIRNGKMAIGPTIQIAMIEHCDIELLTIRRYVASQLRGPDLEEAA